MLRQTLSYLIFGERIDSLLYKAIRLENKGKFKKLIAKYIVRKISRNFGCYFSSKASVGGGIKFPHPVGIVIGDGVCIANNVTVYQNVTLGAARLGEGARGLYPKVGSDVIIFSGAKIIGDINIGDGAIIGANAVVTKDVPPNCIAVGIPAKYKKIEQS